MIVVDASALIAILDAESDAARYAEAIASADPPLISAATVVETGIVMLNRHGPKGVRRVSMLIQEGGFQVESVTAQHAQLALEAYATYGKGQKSAAGLNYGDCYAYALAKSTRLPLLFKGRDFSATDVSSALRVVRPNRCHTCPAPPAPPPPQKTPRSLAGSPTWLKKCKRKRRAAQPGASS